MPLVGQAWGWSGEATGSVGGEKQIDRQSPSMGWGEVRRS